MGNQLDVYTLIKQQEPIFNAALASDKILWNQEYEFATQALRANDGLLKTALNNPQSLIDSIRNIAAIGISLNPTLEHAYLIPRKGVVLLDISYRGLIHVAESSGIVEWVQAKCVYEGDTFIEKLVDLPTYEHKPGNETLEKLTGVFCVAKKGRDYLTTYMPRAEIDLIRSLSADKSKAWGAFYGEMGKKAVIKRASKTWGAGAQEHRLHTAMQYLNETEGCEFEKIKDITPTNSNTINDLMAEGLPKDEDGLTVEDLINAAVTMDELNSLLPKLKQLPNDKKPEMRKLYNQQLGKIKARECQNV